MQFKLSKTYLLGSVFQLINIACLVYVFPQFKSVFRGVCIDYPMTVQFVWQTGDAVTHFWLVSVPLFIVWIKYNFSIYLNLKRPNTLSDVQNYTLLICLYLRAAIYPLFPVIFLYEFTRLVSY